MTAQRTYRNRDKRRQASLDIGRKELSEYVSPAYNRSVSSLQLPELPADPDEHISLAEMSTRMLKRTRSEASSSITDASAKKPKSSPRTPDFTSSSPMVTSDDPTVALPAHFITLPTPGSASPSFYTTPHPTALTSALKFALRSSRPQQPEELSPMPITSSRRKTSSRNLKENKAIHSFDYLAVQDRHIKRMPSRASLKSLESPFASLPGSTRASPQKSLSAADSSCRKQDNLVHPRNSFTSHSIIVPSTQIFAPKRTLSDSSKDSYIAPSVASLSLHHSQSTSDLRSSPLRNHYAASPTKLRRPSAPTPPRNPLMRDVKIQDDQMLPSDPFALLPSQSPAYMRNSSDTSFLFSSGYVDFNRPPSTLSFYERFEDDGGLELEDKVNFSSRFAHGVRDASTPFSRIYAGRFGVDGDEEMDVSPRSCSSSESQESPSSSQDYFDPFSAFDRTPWISDSLISPPGSFEWNRTPERIKEKPSLPRPFNDLDMLSSDGPSAAPNKDGSRSSNLKSLFQGLNIERAHLPSKPAISEESPDMHQASVRKLPLGPTAQMKSPAKPAGRERRGTIKASEWLPSSFTRRSRSGTIVAKSQTLPLPVAETTSQSIITFQRRTRSGTIVGPAKRPSESSASSSSTCVNIVSPDTTRVEPDGSMSGDAPNMLIEEQLSFAINEEAEESDDELLLKSGTKVELSPPPQRKRQPNIHRPSLPLRKLSRNKVFLHDPNADDDDELNFL